jgi:hypothetical protein
MCHVNQLVITLLLCSLYINVRPSSEKVMFVSFEQQLGHSQMGLLSSVQDVHLGEQARENRVSS